MQKILAIGIISIMLVTGCSPPVEDAQPLNDFKVHAYYVIPADKNFDQDNATRVWRALLEMQRWYQTATGGLTFELLDEENLMEVYVTDNPASFYEDDWWNLLLEEMKARGEPIQSKGTIAIIWIEGISQISDNATALGGTSCEGLCGAALLPISTIIAPTWPPVDLGISLHEMGHTFGLNHPVEISDLPLPPEEELILYSVMNQATVRMGKTNDEHGFLTNEKATLINSPFLKREVAGYQDYWQTNIINFPVTGAIPDPEIVVDIQGGRTVSFRTNIDDALLYYWYFSDGTISNQASPVHEFAISGLYNVTLMVTDKNFMAKRVSKFVQIP